MTIAELRRRYCSFRGRSRVFRPHLVATLGVLSLLASAKGGPRQSNDVPKTVRTPARNVERGKELFKRDGCSECHGSQGQIASRAGPALTLTLSPFEQFASYVRQPSRSMPTYAEKVLSDQDMADIYAFLKTVPAPTSPKAIPLLSGAGDHPKKREM